MAINEQSVFDYSPRWQPKPRKKIKNKKWYKSKRARRQCQAAAVWSAAALLPDSWQLLVLSRYHPFFFFVLRLIHIRDDKGLEKVRSNIMEDMCCACDTPLKYYIAPRPNIYLLAHRNGAARVFLIFSLSRRVLNLKKHKVWCLVWLYCVGRTHCQLSGERNSTFFKKGQIQEWKKEMMKYSFTIRGSNTTLKCHDESAIHSYHF